MYQRVMNALRPLLTHRRGVEYLSSLASGRNIGIIPCLEDQPISNPLRRMSDRTKAHFVFFLFGGGLRGMQIDIFDEDPRGGNAPVQPLHPDTAVGMVYYAARNTGERRFEVQNLEGSENSGHPETVMAEIHPLSADKLQRLM